MYGAEIKEARKTKGLTQMEAAERTGLPQSTISWIEQDKGVPNIQQCVILANLYGMSIDELIGREDYGTGVIQVKNDFATDNKQFSVVAQDMEIKEKVEMLGKNFLLLSVENQLIIIGIIKEILNQQLNGIKI